MACRYQNGTILNDDRCDQKEKPINQTSCTGDFCASWSTGNWSDVI